METTIMATTNGVFVPSTETFNEEPARELVAECFACPTCGERDMDLLEWDADGEILTCRRCKTEYRP